MAESFCKKYVQEKNFGDRKYRFFSLAKLEKDFPILKDFPITLKILAENLLRQDRESDIKALVGWGKRQTSQQEIAFLPARVLMQDFTGVPAVVDLAAMRDAILAKGGEPTKINPFFPVDLVIDHSVMVDRFGNNQAFEENVHFEYQRNAERYQFLKWGQKAFKNFRVVPPGTGICHQVNLEYLAQVVWTREEGDALVAYPDTLVGTDSHTTMVNGLAVLGWGVGGIEAEAAMLGQPISMVIPEVMGVELTGKLPDGTTATDLVLTITEILRKKGVVGKFVEFFGDGLAELSLADRATLANMAPEYGATCGFFPIDEETLRYLTFTGRSPEQVVLVEGYAKEQGLWRVNGAKRALYTETLILDLNTVEASLAGPKRPQDRIPLSAMPGVVNAYLQEQLKANEKVPLGEKVDVSGAGYGVQHGDVLIAAITSCTNTSNPAVMLAAGLLAKKAVNKGLRVKPWVKTSLAPGSQVVTDYLEKAGVQGALNDLGFNLVGYGCTTCIGNSGPLSEPIVAAIHEGDLTVCSVLSGNRNFEGRVNPYTKGNFLASPPLVVAYALAGNMACNFQTDPIGHDPDGNDVFLKDIWPSTEEVAELLESAVTPQMFKSRYSDVFKGDAPWQALDAPQSATYSWDARSTYVREVPFFEEAASKAVDISDARALLILGDSVTTDHISPAGAIKKESPAGLYLLERGVQPAHFNSYGARRGNYEVMLRGTFANVRLQNEITPTLLGGVTKYFPKGEDMTVYDAAMAYKKENTPLVVVAGKEYGTGSSRDWAAKGTRMLGIKVVLAESFERIHRSNLIGMGVLPCVFLEGMDRKKLHLTGQETWSFSGMTQATEAPRGMLRATVAYADGKEKSFDVRVRIDTAEEVAYFKAGGILNYVVAKIA